MKPKSILVISDDFLPAATGVGTHIQTMYREFARKGHKVVVMTTRRKGQPVYESWNGIHVQRYRSICIDGFYQALPTFGEIRALIQENNIDIVHFHYLSPMMLLVRRVCKAMNLPQLYTYHMTEDHLTQPPFMRPFRNLIGSGITKFCNSVDMVLFPSQKLMEQAQKKGVTKPCVFLTNPLVPELFNHSPEMLQKLDTPADAAAFNILFAGRLHAEKNIPLLLRAFAKHLKAWPDSRVWIAGEGYQKAVLASLVNQLNLADKVTFLGFLGHDALAAYYNFCDVFVLPSLVETQGMVAMEAMRFSKPVIVTKEIVSARELVEPDVNGYIVDAHDESELAARLAELAASPELRSHLGTKGYERSSMYDPEAVAGTLAELYQQVGRTA